MLPIPRLSWFSCLSALRALRAPVRPLLVTIVMIVMIGGACAPFRARTRSSLQTSVITVPIRVVNDMLFVTASVNGHTGLWLLDSGAPLILINREYLQPAARPSGLDTVAGPYPEDSALASGHVHVDTTWRTDSVTMQLGSLTFPLQRRTGVAVTAPLPKLFEQLWGVKPLGILDFAMVLRGYESVIDYTHQQLTLIPIDRAGRRLVDVPRYTTATTIPFISHATEGGWFIAAQIGGQLDTLLVDTGEQFNKVNTATSHRVGSHLSSTGRTVFDDLQTEPVMTVDHVSVAGYTFDNVPFSVSPIRMDGVGTEFFRQVGVVGFNWRARRLMLYRSDSVGVDAPTSTAGVTAFVSVTVIPMDRERVLPNRTVLVHGGHITAIGPAGHVRIPAQAVRIDGHGKYLIPGLADMHTHVGMGDSVIAEQALFLWLANGVTTIRNLDYLPPGGMFHALSGPALLRLRARAAAGTLPSPRIYTSSAWSPDVDGMGGLGALFGGQSTPLDSVAAYVAAYKAAGYDFLKIRDEDAVTAESLAVAARRVGLPIVGHVPDDLPVQEALRIGYRSIEHLTGYLPALVRRADSTAATRVSIQNTQLSDSAFLARLRRDLDLSRIPALVALTRQAGVWNCPTLELQDIVAPNTNIDTLANWPEVRYASPALLKQWHEVLVQHGTTERIVDGAGGTLDALQQLVRVLQSAGAGLLSGTDASTALIVPYLLPGFSLHRELAALVAAGLTPYQALATSTRNVAAYFGTLGESGTVTVGKRADLVLLDGNPLVDIHQTMRIAGVMRNGTWFSQSTLEPQVAAVLKAWESKSK